MRRTRGSTTSPLRRFSCPKSAASVVTTFEKRGAVGFAWKRVLSGLDNATLVSRLVPVEIEI